MRRAHRITSHAPIPCGDNSGRCSPKATSRAMRSRSEFAAGRRNSSPAKPATTWERHTTTPAASLIFPASSYHPNADWSRSDNDQRHKFDMLASAEAGNWFNFGTALSIYSGKPVNVTTGNDENRDGLALDRPAG